MSKATNWLSCGRARNDEEILRQIARLIYRTDPHIYPSWRRNIDDFVDLIVPYMTERGFIFNHQNIFVARQPGDTQPLGILVALNADTDLDFDYSVFDDEASRFVIKHYLQKVIQQRQTLPENTILLINLCVDPDYRTNGIGSQLIYDYIWRMKARGINTFQLNCLQKNELAAQMYQKMGFTITDSDGIGFDGTEDPQVKIYTMAYAC